MIDEEEECNNSYLCIKETRSGRQNGQNINRLKDLLLIEDTLYRGFIPREYGNLKAKILKPLDEDSAREGADLRFR